MSISESLKNDIRIRRNRLQKTMQKQGFDACIITTNVNLFYLTGMVYTGFYYLPVEGVPIHFVKLPCKIDLENVVYIYKPEQMIDTLNQRGLPLPKNMLLETDAVPYNQIMRLLNTFNLESASNASILMRQLRSIKTDYEITQIKACARKHEAVYSKIPQIFHHGMTDTELQIEIEREMRLQGSIGIFRSFGANMDIFMGSLLAGDNAQTPSPFDFALGGAGISPIMPIGSSNSPITEGQTFMVDMAGNFTPWMTDMSRVFSFGETSDLAYRAHQVSIDIHHFIAEKSKIGTACAEMYAMAEKFVEKEGLSEYFMGTKQHAKFVGHGLGLEINEPPVFTPRSKELLEKNMVIALEPKFVIPNIGPVGIENTYIVTSSGLQKITIFEEKLIKL